MKKLSLLVGGLVMSTMVLAQKPDAGTPLSLEGQFGWNASTLSYNTPSVRLRYFLQDNIAVRATFAMNNKKTTDNFYELVNNGGGVGTEINRVNSWGLSLGAEYHFEGTDRLSPYAGLDVSFGGGNNATEWDKYDGLGYNVDHTREITAKTSTLGVSLVAGTDFYFAENFYMGLELGLGFGSLNTKPGTDKWTIAGVTTDSKSADKKESTFRNTPTGLIRLGWRF
jgi:outer membrane protein W